MIADWTVEIGPESPHIVVPWEGWVNLIGPDLSEASRSKADPSRIDHPPGTNSSRIDPPRSGSNQLAEAADYPELLPLLALANRAPTFTSKVDVFPVSRDEVDPEIAEAGLPETAHGLASYLDVLLTPMRPLSTHGLSHGNLSAFETYEQIARATAQRLAATPLPRACAEIVLRPGRLYDQDTFGFTLYAMGFGANAAAARLTWSCAAMAALEALQQAVAHAHAGE